MRHYQQLKYPRNLYAAFVSTMDQRIGQLLDKVHDLGLTNDTIVIFQSDHGHSVEIRAHGGGGSAGPHRGWKGTLYEGGLRVPAIISWPGQLPQNQVRDQLATGCDWYPTILDLCGLPAAGHPIDGKSLLPVIRSATAPTPHARFHWEWGKTKAVREGDWKLLVADKRTELYDLPRDLGEARNLAGQHPEIVERLQKASREYWEGIARQAEKD